MFYIVCLLFDFYLKSTAVLLPKHKHLCLFIGLEKNCQNLHD